MYQAFKGDVLIDNHSLVTASHIASHLIYQGLEGIYINVTIFYKYSIYNNNIFFLYIIIYVWKWLVTVASYKKSTNALIVNRLSDFIICNYL